MRFTICNVVFAAIFGAALLPGQTLPGRFIVELAGTPAAKGKPAGKLARRAAVRQQHRQVRASIEAKHGHVLDTVEIVANALIVQSSDPAGLSSIPGVMRVHPVRLYHKTLDRAVGIEKISDAWAQIGGSDHAGSGIKIGIIDTGIDSQHPAFQDPSLTVPDGFPKVNRDSDLQYTNSKIIVARSYDYNGKAGDAHDSDGHGTGVAMIAAGGTYASGLGNITGVAPKAWLGNYKVFPDSAGGAPTDQILKALDDAVNDGMDVVNLSLGSVVAEDPSTDVLVQAVARATQAGIVVVIAAGNDGPDANTISSPGTSPSAITVGASENDRFFAAHANVSGGPSYTAFASSTAASTPELDGPIVDVSAQDPTGLACDPLPPDSLSGKLVLILRGTCTFQTKLNNAQSAGATGAIVYTDPARPPVPMDAGSATLPAMMIANADGVDLKQRLTVAPIQIQLDFVSTPVAMNYHASASYSGRGPSVDFAIKPDLVAVGSNILTAAPTAGHSFTVGSGTSFSSPMVTGAAAILKAARPGLTVDQYRSLLINSAAELTPDTAPSDVEFAGAGLLNVSSALNNTLAITPSSLAYGTSSGTIDLSRPLTITNIGGAPDTFTVTVRSANGSLTPVISADSFDLAPGDSRNITVRLQGTAVTPGSYEGIISVRGAQTGSESRVPYWFAVPGTDVNAITILYTPDAAKANSTGLILFRLTDTAGVPLHMPVQVSTSIGMSRVISVVPDDADAPGSYAAKVRFAAGTNVFQIEAGGKTAPVSVTVH